MLFTRTLRRKMMFGLVLVLIMLITLSLTGISGLSSYRNVVDDWDFSINQAPQRTDLSAAIGALFEPLLHDARSSQALKIRQIEFQEHLSETREEVLDYRRKLELLPPTSEIMARRPVTNAILADLSRRLTVMSEMHDAMIDRDRNVETRRAILREVAQLSALIRRLPDYQDGLKAKLDRARQGYRARIQILGWTTALVVILFAGLVRSGYVGIFAPLRTLHQGAQRVAQGDFDYRVEISTHDEMAELAESFNKMTARFQEIADDLDRQVCERSKQLVRSERLAGIGFLAAGVAHEINNPLSAIAMAAESLDSRVTEHAGDGDQADRDVAVQYLGMIQRESFRCQQITRKLLDFARGTDATRSRTDLTSIVHEVLSMVGHMSKYQDRKIQFDRSEPCHVEANGPEIQQVVLNLVANALESMESGGRLNVTLLERTDQVQLTFEDNGCGMTPDVIEHLFEPFFTRRKNGKGTGLGMSISHRIISDHGGTIEAASDGPGCGSTLRILLPRESISSSTVAA